MPTLIPYSRRRRTTLKREEDLHKPRTQREVEPSEGVPEDDGIPGDDVVGRQRSRVLLRRRVPTAVLSDGRMHYMTKRRAPARVVLDRPTLST